MSREIHEYYVRPMNATPEALENHLNAMGSGGWEVYPIPFPVKDKPVLIMHRSRYVTDDPAVVQARVNSLVKYVKEEYPPAKDDETLVRRVVELVAKELL